MNRFVSLHPFVRIALALLLLVVPQSCGRGKKAAAPAAPPVVHIGAEDVVVVKEDRLVTGPTLSGTLTARDEATVRAQVAGSVTDVRFDEGEHVTAGALMARVDPGALGASEASAQSGVVSARAALATAEKEQSRQESLFRSGIVAKRDVEVARQQTANARAQLANAQSQAVSANVQLGHTTVEAPVSGVVSSREVDEGDVVQAGSALFDIVDLSTLQLEASVPTDQLTAIRAGVPVEFDVKGVPNRTFHGRISRINPSVDPATRQIQVFAELPNEGSVLVEGLFAEGRVNTASRTALVVPSAAIDRRMSTPSVARVRNHRVERVSVVLGLVDERNDRVEIRSGVVAGDVLLAGASQQLAAGTQVDLAGNASNSTPEPAR